MFRIAHQNTAQNSSCTCDHWVLIDFGPAAQKEARLGNEILERFNGKNKFRVALSNTRVCRPSGGGRCVVEPRNRKDKRDIPKSTQRRIAIERHNRNAAELSRHYIEWHHTYLECKDCGCRNKEENFKLMAEEHCGWHQDMQPTHADKRIKRRLARRARDTKHCMTIRDGAPAFTWLVQSKNDAATTWASHFCNFSFKAGCTF